MQSDTAEQSTFPVKCNIFFLLLTVYLCLPAVTACRRKQSDTKYNQLHAVTKQETGLSLCYNTYTLQGFKYLRSARVMGRAALFFLRQPSPLPLTVHRTAFHVRRPVNVYMFSQDSCVQVEKLSLFNAYISKNHIIVFVRLL